MAWLFFRYGIGWVCHAFSLPQTWVLDLALLAMAGVTLGGWRHWKQGKGFHAYNESSLCHNLGDTGQAAVAEYYSHRITGPAYILSQIFLGGALLALKAWDSWKARIAFDPALELRLHETLRRLNAANKWQSLSDHPEHRQEIFLLAQMSKIDFSSHGGNVRFKALTNHGI